MITSSVIGMEQIKQNIASVIKSTDPADRRKIFIESSPPLIADMKARAPVDTGWLRDSIGINTKKGVQEGELYIGVQSIRKRKGHNNPSVYGKVIEYGLRKRAAKPFIRPAFDNDKNNFINRIANILKRKIISGIR